MTAEPVRAGSSWLALREPADASARAHDLARSAVEGAPPRSAPDPRPRLRHRIDGPLAGPAAAGPAALGPPRPRRRLLAAATTRQPPPSYDGTPVTRETRSRDITRLGPDELADATLITASALLDMMTRDELHRLAASRDAVGCAVLVTLSVTGRVELAPADPLDRRVRDAFNAHQSRVRSAGRLLGPDAVPRPPPRFNRLGFDVRPMQSVAARPATRLVDEGVVRGVGGGRVRAGARPRRGGRAVRRTAARRPGRGAARGHGRAPGPAGAPPHDLKVVAVSDLPVLTPEEQRVLGSLLEKQMTVPASYPLTAQRAAHRLQPDRAAATRSSTSTSRPSRAAARGLKERGLLRIVWSDTGRRTLKYHQTLDERLGLGRRRAGAAHRAAAARPAGAGRAARPAPSGCTPSPTAARSRRACAGWRERRRRWCASSNAAPASRTAAGSTCSDRSRSRRRPPCRARRRPRRRARRGRRARATRGCARRTTPSRRPTPTTSPTSWPACPSRAGCSTGSPRTPAGGPVVEVGCGPGHVTAYLADGRRRRHRASTSRRRWSSEARRRFPDGSYEVGDLRRLMRPGHERRVGGRAGLVLADPPRRLRAARRGRRAGPPARPRRLAGPRAARRGRGAAPRRWFDHEVDLDFVLHDPATWSASSRQPGSSTSSGTSAARSPGVARRPSGST